MKNDYSIAAVEKVLDILESLSREREPADLPGLSKRLGIPKPTLFRYLVTLEKRGYVRKRSDNRYELGLRLLELSTSALDKMTLHEVALPYMRELQERFQETVNLAVLEGLEIVYIEILESPRAFRMSAHVGGRQYPHTSSLGKAILAYLPEEEVERIARATGLPRQTPNTICSLERLKEELALVRKQGYATDWEESEEGACCVGVPIFDRRGRAVAAISLSGPALRFSPAEVSRMGAALREVSLQISQRNGYLLPSPPGLDPEEVKASRTISLEEAPSS